MFPRVIGIMAAPPRVVISSGRAIRVAAGRKISAGATGPGRIAGGGRNGTSRAPGSVRRAAGGRPGAPGPWPGRDAHPRRTAMHDPMTHKMTEALEGQSTGSGAPTGDHM